LASTYGSGLAGLSGLTDRRSERPLREVGVFRYVQDFLYQGEMSGNTTAGTRREVSLFAQPEISSVTTTGMVWPPYAGNRNHFSAEKRHLPGFFLGFWWRHDFFSKLKYGHLNHEGLGQT